MATTVSYHQQFFLSSYGIKLQQHSHKKKLISFISCCSSTQSNPVVRYISHSSYLGTCVSKSLYNLLSTQMLDNNLILKYKPCTTQEDN
jgi:hypothetical protein